MRLDTMRRAPAAWRAVLLADELRAVLGDLAHVEAGGTLGQAEQDNAEAAG